MLLQERRGVRAVRIPTPDMEPPARLQGPRHVPEPGIGQAVEFFVRHEVIGERPILRSQLLPGRFGFLRVPGHIHRLVVRRLERRETRGERIVRPRLHLLEMIVQNGPT